MIKKRIDEAACKLLTTCKACRKHYLLAQCRDEGVKVKARNTCDYLIVSCMDFRIQGHIRSWAERHLLGEPYDYVGFAGSTKELDVIISQVDIAANLHSIKQVYLIHHEDCGAYGNLGSLEVHTADLQKAKQFILGKHPDLIVDTLYLKLNGEISPTY